MEAERGGRGGQRDGAGAEKLVGESPGPRRGGGGLRSRTRGREPRGRAGRWGRNQRGPLMQGARERVGRGLDESGRRSRNHRGSKGAAEAEAQIPAGGCGSPNDSARGPRGVGPQEGVQEAQVGRDGRGGEWPGRAGREAGHDRTLGPGARGGGFGQGATGPHGPSKSAIRDGARGTRRNPPRRPGQMLPSSPPPPTAHPGREPGARPRTSGAPPPPPAAPARASPPTQTPGFRPPWPAWRGC